MDRIDKVQGTFDARGTKKDLPPSAAAIARLPRYYRVLCALIEDGVLRISSGELGEKMGLTASQVRQDFRHFGDFGQQGYGYQVKYLHRKIGALLGHEEQYHAVIVGSSPVADLLIKTGMLVRAGLDCVAWITHCEEPETRGSSLPSYPWSARETALREHPAEVAILCTPPEVARETVGALTTLGVRGIFNCTGVPLPRLSDKVFSRDFAPEETLYHLLYDLTQDTKIKDTPT